eukprot:2939855-Pyramimonas_sp.AAC.1
MPHVPCIQQMIELTTLHLRTIVADLDYLQRDKTNLPKNELYYRPASKTHVAVTHARWRGMGR